MQSKSSWWAVLACVLVGVLVLPACGPTPEPQVVEKEVTQIVRETVMVAGTPEFVEREVTSVVTVEVEKVVTPTSPPPPEPVTITWATWGGATQAGLYAKALEKFHASQDLVRVENINSASVADHQQKVQTMVGGGTPPDVIMMGGETIPAFAANGVYQPLDGFIAGDADFDEHDYYGITLDAMRYNDQIWALPGGFNIVILYYNKDMFDEAGLEYPTRDWDQEMFLEAAKALTKREDGRVIQYGFADSPLNMWFWIWQNGGEVFDNNVDPSVMLLHEPAALETVKWYFALALEHGVMPTLPEIMQSGGQQELFASGRVAMLADHRGATQVLGQITDFEWGMTELPRGSEGRATVFNWAGHSIAAGSEHPEAAWEFLKWFTGPEAVPIFIEGGNQLPALLDLMEDPSLEIEQPFIDSLSYAQPFFASPKWSELLPTMLQYLQLMAVGEMPVEEAVPLMKQDVDALLAGE